ncbi:MAG: stage III sporulation protein AD [Clostridia bacterium]|nr:stage III sporulation protein AD [Clostridia bacterium]
MEEIFKILGIAIVTAVSAILLKSSKPELSFAVTVTGVIIILLFVVDCMKDVLTVFQVITAATGIESGLIKLLLKIIGVGYVTEFGAGILTDFGSVAIADKVVLGGKLTIVVLSLPILQSLLQLIGKFLELV